MQREQFLDLLTVAEVMLFIFGRLLMSGSASAPGAPGDLTCTPKCPAPGKKKKEKEKKTCEMSPDRWCSLTQALLYNFSCGTRRRPLTLSQSVSFAPSPVSFLLPFYQFFFSNLIFSLSTAPLLLLLLLHHIHHQTLTSICCLPSISWLVIVFL